MALTTGNFLLPDEAETDVERELRRKVDLEAAYRREHAAYAAQGRADRADEVVAAAKAELGVDWADSATVRVDGRTAKPAKPASTTSS